MTGRGQSYPPGSKVGRAGTNFSLYSRAAVRVEILLFDHEDDATPARIIDLDAASNRSYHYWHVFVPGIKAGQLYGYRVHGPWDPANGQRFDASRVLLDPYARAVAVPLGYSRAAGAPAMKSVTIDSRDYDWEGDRPLQRPASRTVIYEMHVRGFTRHPNSGVAENLRGTYRGVIEKIPYLQATRHHGGRVAARVPVRFSRRSARAQQLLGLRAGFVLRPPPGLQLAPGCSGTGP